MRSIRALPVALNADFRLKDSCRDGRTAVRNAGTIGLNEVRVIGKRRASHGHDREKKPRRSSHEGQCTVPFETAEHSAPS